MRKNILIDTLYAPTSGLYTDFLNNTNNFTSSKLVKQEKSPGGLF